MEHVARDAHSTRLDEYIGRFSCGKDWNSKDAEEVPGTPQRCEVKCFPVVALYLFVEFPCD
jgi:hypothetical protein